MVRGVKKDDYWKKAIMNEKEGQIKWTEEEWKKNRRI